MPETKWDKISKEELSYLVEQGNTLTKLAGFYKVSRTTLYRALKEYGLEIKKYLGGNKNEN